MTNNSLDILLMSDNCLDTVGGEQESVKIIIEGIKDEYSIGVIQPGTLNNREYGVIYFDLTKKTRIKHLIRNPLNFIRYILRVKNIINTYRPKIVHTQAQVSFFIVALLKKFRLVTKDNCIIHTERGLYTKYNRLFKYIFYFFMKELNILVTTTQFNMKYWKYALKKRKYLLEYRIIENTAGKIFETLDETMLNSNNEKIVVGFAGRYTEWKNWPLAVDITKKLNERIGDALEVKMAVGCLDRKALENTRQMYTELRKMLGNRFDGKVNITLKEMDRFYYEIDVFILTSHHNTESFGRTLVEAMSRNTLVLTTNAGGSVEVVGDPKNVYTSADEFVERIVDLYNDRKKLEEEKTKNLVRVRETYSLNNNIEKHFELYSSILRKGNSKGVEM